MELATALSEDDNSLTITKLEAVRDNNLLNKPITHTQTISTYDNTINFINLKIPLRWIYLNKMIAKDVTNTYYAMHRRICWWLTSKRKKCHALLQRQWYNDNIIPWCNDIFHLGYIHPLIHSNLHEPTIRITFI